MENNDKKTLSLEDVLAGIGPIVQANPTFIYPQQAECGEDERCECLEYEDEDDPEREQLEEYYDYSECDWHLDDDNTCRYVKWDDTPACVVGHYFYETLGFRDLANFEAKAPQYILEAHGYEVEEPARRFLNTIQSQQDQGWDWDTAYNQAVREVDRYATQ
jgi:hypothetical protein